MRHAIALLIATGLVLVTTACGERQPASSTAIDSAESTPAKSYAAVDAKRLRQADSEPGQWMSHGRDYFEQRYSPLDQINATNVDKLGLAWSFDLTTKRGIEATSIVVDGVMYTTSAWSIVYALDARTGERLWRYDPDVAKEKARHTCCDVVNRGVAVWEGQVFLGALDGRLIALDAKTGTVNWSVATVDPERAYTITGAPRVVKGKVIIGNGGAEFDVRGFVSAYNADDGSLAWRFYTVPGNPAKGFENEAMAEAAKTWTGEWWKYGGGGTVWDSMAYDPELNLLYIGVGNGAPWNQAIRSPDGGDNLFLSSIVALDPDNGEYVWHYQTTPGETWDYTATQHIILADIAIGGETRKVLMQAPKNGFFYVIDRATGELISADNYVGVTWASHIDMSTGRPVETAGARYVDKAAIVFPSYLGGHNWHPMSFSRDTGLVYIPVLDFPASYGQAEVFKYKPDTVNTGVDGIVGSLPDKQAERDALRALMKGRLLAWNPVTQKEAWRVEHSGPWNGGTLATAGNLVFQGDADGQFVAYAADTGKPLWRFAAQTGIVAPPMTYTIDGEQYVTVNVGWGGAFALVFGEYVRDASLPNTSRVLTFKLGADGKLPPLKYPVPQVVFNPPAQTGDANTRRAGYALYQDNCMGCHGLNAVSGRLIPDLRGSATLHDAQSWQRIVHSGVLKTRGMPAFRDYLSKTQVAHIRDYVIEQAWRGKRVKENAATE